MKKLDTGNHTMYSFDDVQYTDAEYHFIASVAIEMLASNETIAYALNKLYEQGDKEDAKKCAQEINLLIRRAICSGISYGRKPLEENELIECAETIHDILKKAGKEVESEQADNPQNINPSMLS